MSQIIAPGFDPFWCGDQGIVPYLELFGPQILGRYRLHGDELVIAKTVFDSPTVFTLGADWTSTTVTTPDANTLRETAANSEHKLTQTYTGNVAVGPLGFSFDIEADGRWDVKLRIADGGAEVSVWFDADAGVKGVETGATGTITPLGGTPARYRCRVDTGRAMGATGTVDVYLSPDGSTTSYAGDTGKGIKIYNALFYQDSILTAPNDPTLAAYNLEHYGDRYDFTNPNKASQLVVGADVWDGLPGAIASGANWIACDPMAARFTGDDQPLGMLAAAQLTAPGSGGMLFGLGNTGTATPSLYAFYDNAGTAWRWFKRDNVAGTSQFDMGPSDGNRNILALTHSGVAVSSWQNTTPLAVGVASNVGDMTVNTATFGAWRRTSTSGYLQGIARELVMVMAANPARMLAGYNLMRAENP